MTRRVFFYHYYLATSETNWAQIFTGLIFSVCWDKCTASGKTGLWQLPTVSSVFKSEMILKMFYRPTIKSWCSSNQISFYCHSFWGKLSDKETLFFPLTSSRQGIALPLMHWWDYFLTKLLESISIRVSLAQRNLDLTRLREQRFSLKHQDLFQYLHLCKYATK